MSKALFRLGWLLVGLTSCSLSRFDSEPCSSNAQCVEAFGFGQTCVEGLCSQAPTNDRCSETFPPDLMTRPELYSDALVVGTLFNHADPRRLARQRAARLAATQISDAGGLDGTPVAMVFCDIEENDEIDESDIVTAAIESANYLTESLNVRVIVGPSASDHVVAVFEALRDTGIVLISPSATSPLLTSLEPSPTDEDPGLLWRTAPPDTLQGPSIAQDMNSRGVTSVAILNRTGAYGDGLADVFTSSFEELGGSVTQASFSNESELSEQIVETGAADAEEVLFISANSSDILGFLEVVPGRRAFDDKSLFLTDGAATREAINVVTPELAPRIRGSRPMPLNEEEDRAYANFLVNYQTSYGDDADEFSFTAHAFDATWLAFAGATWSTLEVGTIEPESVARGLRRVSSGDEVPLQSSGWSSVVNAFQDGDSVDVTGASGALDFCPETEELEAPIEIWTVEGAEEDLEIVPVGD